MPRIQEIDQIEKQPEPDCLEGFSSPRMIKKIYGHEQPEADFKNYLSSGRLPHAWLVTGPKGIGKATLIYRFTRYLLATEKDREKAGLTLDIPVDAASSRLVTSLSHPELLVLRRPYDTKSNKLKTEITVDEVRRLKNFLSLSKTETNAKIVIVDPADELNLSAANAILKSIEEPLPRTYFFLISSTLNNILPTLRSRCRVLRCNPLSKEDLRKAVTQELSVVNSKDSETIPIVEDWNKLERIASGSVGFALKILSLRGELLYDRLISYITDMPQCNWKDLHILSDELASQAAETKFETFYELLLSLLARLIYSIATDKTETIEEKIAQKLIKKDKLLDWTRLWEKIVNQKNEVDIYNLDKKSFLISNFQKMVALSN